MKYFLLTILFLWLIWVFWYGVGGPLRDDRRYPFVDANGNYIESQDSGDVKLFVNPIDAINNAKNNLKSN